MKKIACLLPLVVALAACGSEQSATPPAPEAKAKAAPADQPAQPVPPQSAADLFAARLDKALAGDWRSADNKARDQYRHPKQTLEFFGLKSGDTVVEITPGGGWYTEVLAPLLQGDGKYVAALAADASSDYARNSNEKFRAKLKEGADQYGGAEVIEFDPKAPSLGGAGSADVVLTFRNVHNWIGNDSAAGMFKAFFEVLKPGGTLGVVEHRAAAGAELEKIKDSGYLPQDVVVKLATDAGFQLVAQSEINANPKDTKDYEKGVWTLPPSLALKDKDREKYLAIGESDRMTLKFVKPQGDQIFSQAAEGSAAKE
ncbi:methyltransferase [Dokdonella sp.]|uniref:class I SAM-dependent methyltransferase n=1 Tax=Dokdonella sp. TaxID=2291710 RepID=UPI00261C9848|nr:methyltransferase [Dokdonella sp.]